MCTGTEFMQVGTAVGGVGELFAGSARADAARADAASARDAGQQQARNILRETERRRASARAATAASGAAVDSFSIGAEQDIAQAGETDAAMAILSGERKARSDDLSARMQMSGGFNALGSSLFRAANVGNWRGAKNGSGS